MKDILLILKPKNENADFQEIVIKVANNEDINLSDFKVSIAYDIVYTFKEEIIKHILEHGFNSIVNSQALLEHIVVQGETQPAIISTMQLFLDTIMIDNELIILDPYFFAKTRNPQYVTLITDILSKYLAVIDKLIIITNTYSTNIPLKTAFEAQIRVIKPGINITHQVTDDFHDRFWISNGRTQGIVTGTSLNGFGNKYSLIDKAKPSDIADIIAALTAQLLI